MPAQLKWLLNERAVTMGRLECLETQLAVLQKKLNRLELLRSNLHRDIESTQKRCSRKSRRIEALDTSIALLPLKVMHRHGQVKRVASQPGA